ncbi:hypothetical protein O3P69_011631 [Scylla paramamosain]|uniref:Uncharacterized protein n=1 Tax=Scylla paramamosain TaxID=85552 RepID=A0AAW0T995_SCYPA
MFRELKGVRCSADPRGVSRVGVGAVGKAWRPWHRQRPRPSPALAFYPLCLPCDVLCACVCVRGERSVWSCLVGEARGSGQARRGAGPAVWRNACTSSPAVIICISKSVLPVGRGTVPISRRAPSLPRTEPTRRDQGNTGGDIRGRDCDGFERRKEGRKEGQCYSEGVERGGERRGVRSLPQPRKHGEVILIASPPPRPPSHVPTLPPRPCRCRRRPRQQTRGDSARPYKQLRD